MNKIRFRHFLPRTADLQYLGPASDEFRYVTPCDLVAFSDCEAYTLSLESIAMGYELRGYDVRYERNRAIAFRSDFGLVELSVM